MTHQRLVLQQAFSLDVTPTAKGRGRARVVAGRPMIYTAHATRDAEHAIRDQLRAAGAIFYPRGVPVALRVTFAVARPKDVPRSEHYSPRRPDLPNYVMLVCDAGTGVLWEDDSQIVTIEAVKEHMDRPRVLLATGVPLARAIPDLLYVRMAWERWVADAIANAELRLPGRPAEPTRDPWALPVRGE